MHARSSSSFSVPAVLIAALVVAAAPSNRSGISGQAASQAPAQPSAAPGAATSGIDLAGMDRSVAPGDDFFRFANGAWYATAEIPPDRSSVGAWSKLSDETAERTRSIIEGIRAGAADGSDERKVADYYATYMDEAAIDAAGLRPLEPLLARIGAVADRGALVDRVCSDLRADVDPLNATNFYTDHLFGLFFSQDLNDPGRYVPYLLQGGLGMPDRDYYLDPAPQMEKIRGDYRRHVAAVLKLAGVADPDARADRIIALERSIAAAHWTRTQSADVARANNPWTRRDFPVRAPGLDWDRCFAAAGLQKATDFIVWQPEAVTGIAALVASEPIETWRDYLTFHQVDHFGYVLPRAFVDERFSFYGTALSGTSRLRDRWKRAVDATSGALGDAVGRLYVQRYFPPESKARLQAVVTAITDAFDRRIERLEWMKPETKASARAKLAALIVGIGYPDRWRGYGGLRVVRGEALMNAFRAELFDYESERGKLGRPVDRHEWWMTPQTVNALNLPAQNALNFPAAILRPPFYDPAADPALVFGAIGAIIGHEISHSFDDQGSQFDARGKLASWWTAEDFAHFKDASARLVAQYNAYEPLPGLHVNGQLTLSENIADVAGLSAAYDAYRASTANGTPAVSGGLTGSQLFFLSYAQAWRTKMREPLLRQLIVIDGHAPAEFRADTVRNLDGWYDAFDVTSGQRLFLPPAGRVRVW
jgi:predicted metalloendopeptidase